MRTIAHISDLHFGRVDAPVAEGLVQRLTACSPDLLIVSGDFTQRARHGQFEQAAAFLQRLPTPRLVVPGNHDIPLWNLYRRLARPLTSYRRYISDDLFPTYRDAELYVLGLNTARSVTRTSGWFSRSQLEELKQRMQAVPPGVFKVVVTHHPFIPSPHDLNGDILRGVPDALDSVEAAGVDLLLAGHLHRAYHDDIRVHHGAGRRSILSVQAGTCISTRRRGEPNAWNWITVSQDLVTVAVQAWNGAAFHEARVTRFARRDDVWTRDSASQVVDV